MFCHCLGGVTLGVRGSRFLSWLLLNLLVNGYLVFDEVRSPLADFRLVLSEAAVRQILSHVELAIVVGVGDSFRPVVFSLKILLDDASLRDVTSWTVGCSEVLRRPRVHIELRDSVHDRAHVLLNWVLHSQLIHLTFDKTAWPQARLRSIGLLACVADRLKRFIHDIRSVIIIFLQLDDWLLLWSYLLVDHAWLSGHSSTLGHGVWWDTLVHVLGTGSLLVLCVHKVGVLLQVVERLAAASRARRVHRGQHRQCWWLAVLNLVRLQIGSAALFHQRVEHLGLRLLLLLICIVEMLGRCLRLSVYRGAHHKRRRHSCLDRVRLSQVLQNIRHFRILCIVPYLLRWSVLRLITSFWIRFL